MPLQDTDVTLVSRSERNAHATLKQVKDFVLGGDSSDALIWSSYPTTEDFHISSPDGDTYADITVIQFKGQDLTKFSEDDTVVLINVGRGSSGTYKVNGTNNATNSIGVSFLAESTGTDIELGDRIIVANLGDLGVSGSTVVFINNLSPSMGVEGDLWYQPNSGNFHIYYDGEWVVLNDVTTIAYDNGIYYKNAVNDLGIDNTEPDLTDPNYNRTLVASQIETALTEMFNSGARTGTLYFPAGTYYIGRKISCINVGGNERVSWVIKGDGTSTKFYVDNGEGGFDIRFGRPDTPKGYKDNYITVEDLAIHPKRAINGYGLYLQNGTDAEAEDPDDVDNDDGDLAVPISGGSNQQYGCQIINVNILADERKPNDVEEKKNANFFNFPLSLINFGRPRLDRVIIWNHAERSNVSFVNNNPYVNYENSYGFKPEDTGIALNLTNCYSPWVTNCYINGTHRYGIYWNSTRGNTEGGTFSQLVINGSDIGFRVSQVKDPSEETQWTKHGRHPHLTLIDSHINSARFGLQMINVKYFHVADVLYYARNDREREITLIDNYLINCHSGVLSNGYSGGSVGNQEKEAAIPIDETGMNTEERREARDDAKAKAPHRIHVMLKGRDNKDAGEVTRNRQILVRDHTLNGYCPQVYKYKSGGDNPEGDGYYTAGQAGSTWDTVDWYAPYQVDGNCADIEIILPKANYQGNPAGDFDSTKYPPENRMISSTKDPVTFSIGGDKMGLVDDGDESVRFTRMRVTVDEASPSKGTITADSYQAENSTGGTPTFVTVRTKSTDITAGEEDGSFEVATSTNGTVNDAMILRQGTAHFPGIIEDQTDPYITIATAPNDENPIGIYYLGDNTGQPDNRIPNAAPGSLLLKGNDKMYFKTSVGWKEVLLK